MNEVAAQKRAIRRRLLAQRDQLTSQTRDAAAADIAALLIPELQLFDRVATFASKRNEVDLHAVHATLLDSGVELAFPKVISDGEMVFIRVRALDELHAGAYGIPEPTGEAEPWDAFDAVLVPGIAFDHDGGRLGFGKGFYDRAIAKMRAVRSDTQFIGVCYHLQLLDEPLPRDAWDQLMDTVATEHGFHPPLPTSDARLE